MLISLASYYTPKASDVWTPAKRFEAGQRGFWRLAQPTYEGQQILWQDAARTVPVSADGDLVRVIDDLSPNLLHATAPSDAARPVYRTDGTLHWLEYDGVDDEASTATTPSIPDNTTGLLVCTGSQSDSGSIFRISQYDTSDRRVFATQQTGGDDVEFTVQLASTFATSRIAYIASAPTTESVMTGLWDGADAFSTVRVNRGTFAAASVSTPAITSVTEEIDLGSYRSTEFWAGRFYGTVVVSDTTDYELVEDYIAGLMGVTL